MAHELELVDYVSARELKRTESYSGATEQTGRRLLRFGILTIGVLCILQAALNVSLRLTFYAKEDTDQLPDNILSISDMCQIDQDSTQLCSCCNNLLRKLFKEYQALKRERDKAVIKLISDKYPDESGSGYPDVSGYN